MLKRIFDGLLVYYMEQCFVEIRKTFQRSIVIGNVEETHKVKLWRKHVLQKHFVTSQLSQQLTSSRTQHRIIQCCYFLNFAL